MITFRFYLVTLVAIFLAVALGVVIGSTFLEPALVQDLNNQVSSVRDSLDERVALIDDLHGQIGDLEEYVEGSAPFAVERTLDGQVVLVVANEGVDDTPVERLVSRLRQAGARTDGIVWVRPGFGAVDERPEVLTGLGLDPSLADAPELQDAVWSAVVTRLQVAVEPGAGEVPLPPEDQAAGAAPDTTTPEGTVPEGALPEGTVPEGALPEGTVPTTGVTDTTAPDGTEAPPVGPITQPTVPAGPVTELFTAEPLALLAEAGWIRLQGIEAPAPLAPPEGPVESHTLSVVVITGAGADEGTPTNLEVARRQAAVAVPTVLADVWRETDEADGERGRSLLPVREDAELAARISTVDDLDRVQGQVAVVLAIRDLGRGVVGHYGYGAGAETVLPPWLGP